MPKPTKQNAERLAKGLQKIGKVAGIGRKRKSYPGPRPSRNADGDAANARSETPLLRLIQSLGEEKIRFQIVGMTAAVLQGVMVTTFDTDIWLDLPTRTYPRVMNLCLKQGATAVSPTVYVLSDGKIVNFLFSVTGLRSFAHEYKSALTKKVEGVGVKVLPLERILQSKRTIMRDKDQAHIVYIERILFAKNSIKQKPRK